MAINPTLQPKLTFIHGLRHRILLILALLAPTAGIAGPAIQHWTTSNGVQVYFVPAPDLPMVDVRIVIDAGSARDGQLPGLAFLSNKLIKDGDFGLDADQVATGFERVGARFSTTCYRDMAIIDLRSLTDPELLNPTIQLAAQLVTKPAFQEDSLERERQILLVALQERLQSPSDIANDAFMAALYADHPYATPTEGTVASVKAIKRSDLVTFHNRYYVGRNTTVAIVGALNRATAEKLAWSMVKDIPAGRGAPMLTPLATPPADKTTNNAQIRIQHPSTQTHILIGQPGISYDDADYFPLYVGNHILGGSGLVSRISEEIREKRGLSYSAYSYFNPMRQAGPFVIGLQTRNDQANEAHKVALETIKQFIETGPTVTELEESKQNITGGFPLRLSSNKKIIGMLATIGFYQLPLDYLDTFTTKVDLVSVEMIKEAFTRRVHPEKMATIMVGNLESE